MGDPRNDTEKVPKGNDVRTFTVGPEDEGQRADKYLALTEPEWSRAFIQKLLEEERVLLRGKAVRKSGRVSAGDVLEVDVPPARETAVVPQDIPLDVRYEDDWLLVVNKPRGMVVHPAAGNPDGTLVNALLYHCGDSLSGINGEIRPGIVHRIDKDTSGLLIVAKTDAAHRALASQIEAHTFRREYRAVLHGHFRDTAGTVDAPIGRSEKDRKKMCVTQKNARHAVTHYKILEDFGAFSYAALQLETGRTHQIRVHMAHIGHTVAGDPVYGPKNGVTELHGQCLHAGLIGFRHPQDGRYIEIVSELPPYFEAFLRKLRNQYGRDTHAEG